MTETSLDARVAALEHAVRTLTAEQEIRALLSRYSFTADLGLADEFAALFTEDGLYDIGDDNVGLYQGRFEGAEALRRLIAGDGMPPSGLSQHHTMGPMVFEIQDDTAFAEGYSVTYVRRAEGIEAWCMGVNHWEFRKILGTWKIHRRHRREVAPGAAPAMIGAAARGEPMGDVPLR
jgi:hypothetical protein